MVKKGTFIAVKTAHKTVQTAHLLPLPICMYLTLIVHMLRHNGQSVFVNQSRVIG